MNEEKNENTVTNKAGKRKLWMGALAALFVTAGVSCGVYWATYGRYSVETDNAYVSGNIVQITPQTVGTVVSVQANDTDFVKAGSPLVRLDEADAKVSLDQAEAQLAQTIREVRALYSNDGSLTAIIAQREADLKRASLDLERRKVLEGTGAVASEEIEHAREGVNVATAALASAREQRNSNHVLIEHTNVTKNPNVQRSAARVREEYLAWQRSIIPAPVSGYIAKRNVQVGQRVKAGDSLMALVPLEQVWIEANFKEKQLREMRIGQPVELYSDIFGKKVAYHGRVAGFSAGTGSAFSLLPAQNATGNWIKVVQRLPVRIELDPKELADHPLQIGLSMIAKVNVRNQEGARLSDVNRKIAPTETEVFASWAHAAEQHVHKLIAANLGGPDKTRTKAACVTTSTLTANKLGSASPDVMLPAHAAFPAVARK